MPAERYAINEFLVDSEFNLPCEAHVLTPARKSAERLTIHHEVGVLKEFPQARRLGERFGTSLRSYDVGTGVLVCVENSIRILLDKKGSVIRVDFDPSDAEALGIARACCVNLVPSLCSLFRGRIPLHAAAVDLGGSRIAVLAPSGTGKTTLLWALVDQGALLANDDVVPVWSAESKILSASSGGLHAKLTSEALEERGLERERCQAMFPDGQEFWVPVEPMHRATSERSLTAIFLLRPHLRLGGDAAVSVRRLLGGTAVAQLMDNTQGLWAVAGLVDARSLLAQYLALAQMVPVYVLRYERRLETLPKLVQAIDRVTRAGSTDEATPSPPERLDLTALKINRTRWRFSGLRGYSGQ